MKINLVIKTLYEVRATSVFKKSLKRVKKQGKDISKLENVIIRLANKEELEIKYRNHNLVNDDYFKNCCECHIEPDWLLVYRYHEEELILLLVDTGSHSEILSK